MGDLLFAIANLSRKLGIEPETALRKANDKFTRRFGTLERAVADVGRAMRDMTLEELEAEWQRVKSRSNQLISDDREPRRHEEHEDHEEHTAYKTTLSKRPASARGTLKFTSRPTRTPVTRR